MNRIKLLRNEQTPKMSQEKLGQLVGVGRTAVAMWEGGKSEPDNATLKKLSKIFGVSVDYILGLTDEREKLPAEIRGLDRGRELPYAETREVLSEGGMHLLMDADAKLPEEHLEEIVEFIKMKQRKYGR